MLNSISTMQSVFKYVTLPTPVVPVDPVQNYIFTTGNYSGSSPTSVKNQITGTNDGSYTGASTDMNSFTSPYYGLVLNNYFSVANTTWLTANTGISITLRVLITTSNNGTHNIIGAQSSNIGQPLGSNKIWLSINPFSKGMWVWAQGNGDSGTASTILTGSGWVYIAVVLGRDLTTGSLSSTALSVSTDYKSSNTTFSSANISTNAKVVNTVSLVDNTTLTGSNMFYDNNNFKVANIKIFQKALTVAEIQADYAT
jgi:hypothetical protein